VAGGEREKIEMERDGEEIERGEGHNEEADKAESRERAPLARGVAHCHFST
jgi:hypothetical protein